MAVSESDFRESVDVTADKTLTAADSGIVQNVLATATITLPATAVGLRFSIRNGADYTATVKVAPVALDQIVGNGFTPADNKAAINTLGQGASHIDLLGNGTTGYVVQACSGAWTREA